jgi:hypothetical protein
MAVSWLLCPAFSTGASRLFVHGWAGGPVIGSGRQQLRVRTDPVGPEFMAPSLR